VNLWNGKASFLQKSFEKFLGGLLTVKANFIGRGGRMPARFLVPTPRVLRRAGGTRSQANRSFSRSGEINSHVSIQGQNRLNRAKFHRKL